jgi:putative transposase
MTSICVKLRELANQRRRFGYRRLHILLRREDHDQPEEDPEALQGGRLGGEASTQPQARSRHEGTCSGAGAAEPALEPRLRSRSDGVGRRFRVLNVVDDVTGSVSQRCRIPRSLVAVSFAS